MEDSPSAYWQRPRDSFLQLPYITVVTQFFSLCLGDNILYTGAGCHFQWPWIPMETLAFTYKWDERAGMPSSVRGTLCGWKRGHVSPLWPIDFKESNYIF